MSQTFALVDCNNFYASCERVFAPALVGRPVVVLSNNDGCIISRSTEAKDVGIPMGRPFFQCRDMLERHNVAVFSSNYTLYGDMSARVMATLGRFVPSLEIYSIDEAFLDLTGLPGAAEAHGRCLRETVGRWTGIPVSIGIGPTKTLAKLASRAAKQNPSLGGVFDMTACPDPDAVLESVAVKDVWGIGRKYAVMLAKLGVVNARQFRDLPADFVKRKMTVGGLHTLLELRGRPCIDLEAVSPTRKSVMASRSFGRPVVALEEMREALAEHVSRAAERLRAGRLAASGVAVFVQTNTFIDGEPQYSNSAFAAVPVATAHTSALTAKALTVLESIFRPGYRYKKVGVMLSGLESIDARQLSLLASPRDTDVKGERLMAVLDATNARWGRDTLRFAASGIEKPWRMRQALRSPRYTTAWDELPVVRAS